MLENLDLMLKRKLEIQLFYTKFEHLEVVANIVDRFCGKIK